MTGVVRATVALLLLVLVPACTTSRPTPTPSAGASAQPRFLQGSSLAFWADGFAGLVGLGDGTTGQVDRTTDGGRSWSTVLRPSTPVGQIIVTGAADAWVLSGCADGTAACSRSLWHSGDRGTTWTRTGVPIDALSFSDSQNGWAFASTTVPSGTPVGDGAPSILERTTDGGATWTPVDAGPCGSQGPSPVSLIAVVARGPESAWLLCGGEGATSFADKTVAVTTDGGASWQVRARATPPGGTDIGQIPLSGHTSGMAIAPDGTAWTWGGRMVPLTSTDGGRNWTAMALGDPDALLAGPAWPLDAQRGYALLWNPNQQATLFEATSDGGQTWSARFSWPISGEPAVSAMPSP